MPDFGLGSFSFGKPDLPKVQQIDPAVQQILAAAAAKAQTDQPYDTSGETSFWKSLLAGLKEDLTGKGQRIEANLQARNRQALTNVAQQNADTGTSNAAVNTGQYQNIELPQAKREATTFDQRQAAYGGLSPTAQKLATFPTLKPVDVATPDELKARAVAEGSASGAGQSAEFEGGGKSVLQGQEAIKTMGDLQRINAQGANQVRVAGMRPQVDPTDKNYNVAKASLDKAKQPYADAQQRLMKLSDTLNEGTPQADALVAPELLTVMAGGQGSGLRMNEAEISRIVGGRSNWESLKATLNKWSTDPEHANSITLPQRQQIRSLINKVAERSAKVFGIIQSANESLLGAGSVDEQRRIVLQAQNDIDGLSRPDTSSAGGEKVVTMAQLQALAKASGTTVEQEKANATAAGYIIR